ncbi:MAG: MFS transporter, partial [Spirochaetaceae bacterium]|nr:MFS transporter [Spirochaetaceae bacterium]
MSNDDPTPNQSENTLSSRSLFGVVAVGAAVALSLFGDMTMYVVLPVHFTELGLSAMQVGILLSANRWVRLLTNHVAERMLRRYTARLLFPLALLVGSLLCAAYSSRQEFVVLLLLRVLWGVCWSFIRHTGVMTTIGVAGPERAGRLMGIYFGLMQVGFVAGTSLGGLFFDLQGFGRTFLIMSAISLAALPMGIASIRLTGATRRTVGSGQARPGKRTLLLEIRGFIVSLVGTGLIMSTLGFLLRARFGDAVPIGPMVVGVATVTGILLAGQHLINGVGSPIFGIIIDRHGLSRTQYVAFAGAGVSLLVSGLLKTTPLLVPLVVIFFICAAVS